MGIREGRTIPNGEEGIANFVQRGEIRVGGLRMCLFEIAGGFYNIRKAMERTIGPAVSTLLYQAGIQGGKSFAASALRIGMIKRGSDGLADCIDIFSQAGFGSFFIVDADYKAPSIVVECVTPPAFEAYAYRENRVPSDEPVCDYARGVLAGFCQQLVANEDIMCIETECRAAGSSRCVFEMGRHDEMMKKAIATSARI